ncbi:hypothetical protein POPTR_013G064900v4 [Populus trichocarpa]|uniref:Uncharacterized protein n=1 Tax=Populus trichocarpa TaxID=3694 RepID=A0ACC0S3K4_POPTR|nr:hypothetical protein POPTR_013G064900v4 [Populus trichocarpa]
MCYFVYEINELEPVNHHLASLRGCLAAPSSAGRRKRAWSESDEDEISERKPQSSLLRENSADLQNSDGEFRDKRQENAAVDDED